MNRFSLFALAAALAAGGGTSTTHRALAAQDAPADRPAARQDRTGARQEETRQRVDAVGRAEGQAMPTHLPAGFKLKEKRDDPILIRNAIESVTDAAVKGDFKDVVERLVDQDRNRLGKADAKQFTDLKDAQKRLRDAWKQKFNKEFDFDLDRDRLFAKAFVIQGEVEDPAVAMRNWPLPAGGEQMASDRASRPGEDENARQAGARNDANRPDANRAGADQSGTDRTARDGGDRLNSNIEKGRDVAVVAFPASHGMPAVRASLIQELGGYKVDVPNSVTAEQLDKSLAEHIRQAADSAGQWPADANEAQVAIAHHVIAGLYNVQAQGGHGPGEHGPGAGGAAGQSR
jgi:hypothetical protein